MDYKLIVEDMMNEVYKKSYNAENAAYSKVLGRAAGTRPAKRRIKRLPAAALSIAIMGIVTVSAGAAINWDIHSLFNNYNDVRRSASAENKATTKWYLERDMYDIDGSQLYAKTENYDDILGKTVHPVDKLCQYDKADIYISGYAYDGYILELYYDVTSKKRSSIHTDEETYTQTFFYSYTETSDKSYGGNSLCYATEGKTKKCMSRLHYRLPEEVNGSLFLLMPDDLMDETQITYEELERKYIDFAFTVEKPYISEYVYEVSQNLTIEMSDRKYANVEYLLISPLSVEFGGRIREDQTDIMSISPTSVYIEYDDGEMLDLSSWTSSYFESAAGQFNGEPGFYKYVDTNGNILDVTHIRHIKLFDQTIEINPQTVFRRK